MKKSIIISVIVIVLVGVGLLVFLSTKENTLTCTLKGKVLNGTEIQNEYIIKYKGKYVTEVKSIETARSDDENALNTYKETTEGLYSNNKDIKYYDYDIKKENDIVIATVIIDYEKINTESLIKVNSANAELIKDGKVNIDDIKASYIKVGATCK